MLLKVSEATTEIVFTPGFKVIVALQFAVLAPLTEPPVALTPLTMTEEIPLLPNPVSLAVPVTERFGLVAVALLAGKVIAKAGAEMSGGMDVSMTNTLVEASRVTPPNMYRAETVTEVLLDTSPTLSRPKIEKEAAGKSALQDGLTTIVEPSLNRAVAEYCAEPFSLRLLTPIILMETSVVGITTLEIETS